MSEQTLFLPVPWKKYVHSGVPVLKRYPKLKQGRSHGWVGPKLNPAVFSFFVKEKSIFFYDFSQIHIWIQKVFLDSWSHDNRGLRELAGNRARRSGKRPLLWFSDHWKCLIVKFYLSVSRSFWLIFNFLQISPVFFRLDGMAFSNLSSEKVKKLHALLLCSTLHTVFFGINAHPK